MDSSSIVQSLILHLQIQVLYFSKNIFLKFIEFSLFIPGFGEKTPEEKYFAELREAIIAGDVQRARECAEKIVEQGLEPLKAIEEAIQPAAKILGEKFKKLEIFLVDLIISADAMKATAEVLTSAIKAKRPLKPLGKVVIATVQGDIYDTSIRITIAR